MRALSLLLASVALATFAGPAQAGDPCPIDITVYDLGAPPWLDRDALLDALTSKDSWVGISFGDAQGGVVVKAVSPASPAAKAGLAEGQVIATADGKAITSHQMLAGLFRDTKPGGTVKLTLADKTEKTLTLGRQDPVAGRLIDYASTQECNAVRRGHLDADRLKTIQAKAFSANRRFRCDDAHKALAGDLESGDLVLVRGSKRVLMANPGYATVCVRATSVDGEKLTDARIEGIFQKLAARYIADRHADP